MICLTRPPFKDSHGNVKVNAHFIVAHDLRLFRYTYTSLATRPHPLISCLPEKSLRHPVESGWHFPERRKMSERDDSRVRCKVELRPAGPPPIRNLPFAQTRPNWAIYPSEKGTRHDTPETTPPAGRCSFKQFNLPSTTYCSFFNFRRN